MVGSHHMCMMRMPWVAFGIIGALQLVSALARNPLDEDAMQKLRSFWKTADLSPEEMEEMWDLWLGELPSKMKTKVESKKVRPYSSGQSPVVGALRRDTAA